MKKSKWEGRMWWRWALCVVLALVTMAGLVLGCAWNRARQAPVFTSRVPGPKDPLPAWLWAPPGHWPGTAEMRSESGSLGYVHRIAATNGWALPMREGGPAEQMMQEEIGVGLPLTCLVHRSSGASQVWSTRPLGFLSLSDAGDAVLMDPAVVLATGNGVNAVSVIPLTPWWPGLIADVVVWTLLWAMVLVLPREWKRMRRARAGRCSRCGYDIKGVRICPECGLEQGAEKGPEKGRAEGGTVVA